MYSFALRFFRAGFLQYFKHSSTLEAIFYSQSDQQCASCVIAEVFAILVINFLKAVKTDGHSKGDLLESKKLKTPYLMTIIWEKLITFLDKLEIMSRI